jgi:DNA-binding NarL/FixJ family response regulator
MGPGSRTGSPPPPEVANSAKARDGFALVKQSERNQPDVAAAPRAPVVTVPVLPRRRHETGKPIEELKRRELDDAAGRDETLQRDGEAVVTSASGRGLASVGIVRVFHTRSLIASNPMRLLLVDDHPVFLEGLAEAFTRQADFEIAGLATDSDAAVEACQRLRPDLVPLDLAMRGLDGLATLARLRQLTPAPPVLMLTSSDDAADAADAVAALDAGAAGYVTKSARYDELVAAIREASTGGRPIGEAVARRIAARDMHNPLTGRELEVLVLLAEGLTYEAIGERLGIAKRTARAHVVAIQEKLDAANNAQVVARGYERGLLRP